ncbi:MULTISPECIES: LuxR C-terminal-related transcriptional regulator [unclassified Streptomyces]|uniref:helix-turn-helix transcriptional regulator n=1 Tax=unclassified Streptomyces TaxID=2593676 RepID=UPI000DC7ADC0|nr:MULTISPECIES: LuxR C-terminal-related transcriptional regulator [unclassified Streptomyces]AWZ03737.1 LuxR family transcriptional regulator [Streptomyces sp. ICC4]AWZ11815.1 LuxR family transcriptional regulator [Streptomyces sp. ICC1]
MPQLTADGNRLYRFVALTPGTTRESACEALDMDAADVEEAADALGDLGLLSKCPDTGIYTPYPVDHARIKVLNPAQHGLNEIQAFIDHLRGDLDELTLKTEHLEDDNSLEVIPGVHDVRQLINGLAEGCRAEVLTSQPGGARDEGVLDESLERTERLLRRGVRMRTLYQHTARFSPVTMSFVERFTPLGAEVCTLAGGFPRCIVFDREVAILPLMDGSHGAAVSRNRHLVSFIAEAFERAWSAGEKFVPETDRPARAAITSDIQQTIVSLLIQGESDNRIAHVVGISLRNCQRHIANIMKSIGARNRLHAGYLLGKEPFGGN